MRAGMVSPAEYISAGFKAGVPIRKLLDGASHEFGPSAWSTIEAQREIVGTCLDRDVYAFGEERERRFIRLLLDEIDRVSDGTVAEELTMAAVARLEHSSTAPFSGRLVELSLLSSSILVSTAQSDIAMRLWEAGVALTDSLRAEGNYIRNSCKNARVLEIGSGTGLTGSAVENAGAASVVLTDVPDRSVLENLRVNVARTCGSGLVEVRAFDVFDIDTLDFSSAPWKVDVILGADLCYCPELTTQVMRAFCEIVRRTSGRGFLFTTLRQEHTRGQMQKEFAKFAPWIQTVNITERVLGPQSGTRRFPFVFWDYSAIEVLEIRPV